MKSQVLSNFTSQFHRTSMSSEKKMNAMDQFFIEKTDFSNQIKTLRLIDFEHFNKISANRHCYSTGK